MHPFSAQEETLLFEGPVGNIEMMLTDPPEKKMPPATAIICHPHPLYGGTMHNKVVTTLMRALHEMGLSTIRFNFRGVGESEGIHDEGRGETDDALAIIDWVSKTRETHAIWLAGFSFGGYVAANAATKKDVAQLITVSPQVSRFPADFPPLTCPWLIVQGDKDDVVSPEALYQWVLTREPKPTVIRLASAGHFFHGQLSVLRKSIEEALT